MVVGPVLLPAESIPARAGEPEHHHTTDWVDWGLSPRERGNPGRYRVCAEGCGSIPARAGEPCISSRPACRATVYPRASGGTVCVTAPGVAVGGLSPRERGNPWLNGPMTWRAGSIPARAGEPVLPRPDQPTWTVYPRASGGTTIDSARIKGEEGLSPRERGNRAGVALDAVAGRSIPARAGEPLFGRPVALAHRVYPRASGGTLRRVLWKRARMGLSPRERGNRSRGSRSHASTRSIPARAGEPPQRAFLSSTR